MVNVLGQHVAPTRAARASHPEWHMHDYGKAAGASVMCRMLLRWMLRTTGNVT